MGIFERWLTLWIALAIGAGLLIGTFAPSLVEAIAAAEVASINLVVAVLIWAMVYPMMVGVDFGAVSGLILLGAAPCTAMVFVWSHLTKGDETYTLVQVSVNDLIMIVAFAPIVAMLLGVTNIVVPWETLVLSTVLYVVLPLLAGMATRRALRSEDAVERFKSRAKPWSIVGLVATVVILFGLQGAVILDRPMTIALIATPILIQSYAIFAVAYAAAYFLRVPHKVAAPCALIGTSNFFELAVAVAVSLFGLNSGAALATVVGVLVEVPVMLSLVAFANRSRRHFPTD